MTRLEMLRILWGLRWQYPTRLQRTMWMLGAFVGLFITPADEEVSKCPAKS